jgi:hypothetical protein
MGWIAFGVRGEFDLRRIEGVHCELQQALRL